MTCRICAWLMEGGMAQVLSQAHNECVLSVEQGE